jgi:hypothetical protein
MGKCDHGEASEPGDINFGNIGECSIDSEGEDFFTTRKLNCQFVQLRDNDIAKLDSVTINVSSEEAKGGGFIESQQLGEEIQIDKFRAKPPIELKVDVTYDVNAKWNGTFNKVHNKETRNVTVTQTWTVDELSGGSWSKKVAAPFKIRQIRVWPHKKIAQNWSTDTGSFANPQDTSYLGLQTQYSFPLPSADDSEFSFSRGMASRGSQQESPKPLAQRTIQLPVPVDGMSQAPILNVRTEKSGAWKKSSVAKSGYYLLLPDGAVKKATADEIRTKGVKVASLETGEQTDATSDTTDVDESDTTDDTTSDASTSDTEETSDSDTTDTSSVELQRKVEVGANSRQNTCGLYTDYESVSLPGQAVRRTIEETGAHALAFRGKLKDGSKFKLDLINRSGEFPSGTYEIEANNSIEGLCQDCLRLGNPTDAQSELLAQAGGTLILESTQSVLKGRIEGVQFQEVAAVRNACETSIESMTFASTIEQR